MRTIQKDLQQHKTGEHIPCGYSLSTIQTFDNIKNAHVLYHEEDCMKKFCSSRREYDPNVINFEETEMLPLSKK